MKIKLLLVLLGTLVFGALTSWGQAPAGSTGLCKDGTFTTAPKKRGACKEHDGVKSWFGSPIPETAAAPPTTALSTPAESPPPKTPSEPVLTTSSAPTPAPPSTRPAQPPQPPPSSGGPPPVWVNLSSKVYHCPTSEWYGKTSNGKYMTEKEAVAMGARASKYQACSK